MLFRSVLLAKLNLARMTRIVITEFKNPAIKKKLKSPFGDLYIDEKDKLPISKFKLPEGKGDPNAGDKFKTERKMAHLF